MSNVKELIRAHDAGTQRGFSVAQPKTMPKPNVVVLPSRPVGQFRVEMVATAKMYLPSYHGLRDPRQNPNRVRTLQRHIVNANGFDHERCEPLQVAREKDGRYAIIDGGGREYMATMLTSPPIAELPCVVLEGKSVAQQIDLYKALFRERTKGRPLDEWLAGRKKGNQVDDIMTALENFGFEIIGSRGNSAGGHVSLNTCLLAHHIGGGRLLNVVLAHLNKTKWGGKAKGMTSAHAAAVTVICGKMNPDTRRLRKILDDSTPAAVHRDAFDKAYDRNIRKPQARHIAWFIAQVLVELYNKGLSNPLRLSLEQLVFEYDDQADDVEKLRDVYYPFAPKSR